MLKKIELPNPYYQRESELIRIDPGEWKNLVNQVSELNTLIENAVRVTGFIDPEYPKGQNYLFDNLPRKGSVDNNTHQAYLIGIEPIRKETAEDVLRDMVRYYKKPNDDYKYKTEAELIDRAKRVLERPKND